MKPEHEIKKPKFNIGDKVIYCPNKENGNKNFWRKRYLRHLIKDHRIVCTRIDELEKNGKLKKHTKNDIIKCMKILDNAYNKPVEIIGIVAINVFNGDSVSFNQCYVNDGHCHSGTRFEYQILIRFKKGKNTLALITGIPVGMYFCFKRIDDNG